MVTEAQVQGLGEFANYSFSLQCPDDHLILLLHEGEQVAILSQTGATEVSLQRECALHLVRHHGWEGCLWERKKDKSDN